MKRVTRRVPLAFSKVRQNVQLSENKQSDSNVPMVFPEISPGHGIVRGNPAAIEDQDLGGPGEGHQAGRTVAGPVGAGAPNKLARARAVGDQGPVVLPARAHHHQVIHDER